MRITDACGKLLYCGRHELAVR